MVPTAAHTQEFASLAVAEIPFAVLTGAMEDVAPSCEAAIDDIVHGLTKWKPEENESEQNAKTLVFEGKDYQDAVDKMESLFLSRMWSDGLPLIPPTKERVDWMLTGTDLPPDMVLTAKWMPRYEPITVRSVALNAVMAGARPEYMPIILAAVAALATEDGLTLMTKVLGSQQTFAPVLIINGPIAKELNINSSFGLMGPGWKANATIGRSISLLMINGAGAHAGPEGLPTIQSFPCRYTWCFAENEQQSPWQPLHVELGYDADASTVTIMAGRAIQSTMFYPPVENILGAIARTMQGTSLRRRNVSWDQLLMLSPAPAQFMTDAGWSKEDVRNYVYEKARISLAEAEASSQLVGGLATGADKSTLVSLTARPEDIVIVVAGGTGGNTATFVPCMDKKVIGEIDRYKPDLWEKLIKMGRSELLY